MGIIFKYQDWNRILVIPNPLHSAPLPLNSSPASKLTTTRAISNHLPLNTTWPLHQERFQLNNSYPVIPKYIYSIPNCWIVFPTEPSARLLSLKTTFQILLPTNLWMQFYRQFGLYYLDQLPLHYPEAFPISQFIILQSAKCIYASQINSCSIITCVFNLFTLFLHSNVLFIFFTLVLSPTYRLKSV